MHQIMILQAVYSISIVILEIPSGYFADVIGRKRTLILGTILAAVGFSIYSFSYGFLGFLLAELVLGFGQSFVSGADSALLYDSLLDNEKEKDYIKYEGRMVSIGNVAEASAGIVGGLIALLSLRYNFYAQTALAWMAIPAAVLLVEPAKHERLKVFTFRTILDVVKDSLFINKALRTNIFLSAVIGTSTLTMAWFAQPFFEYTRIDIAWFGVLWTTLNLTVALTSYNAHRIEKKLGQTRSVLLISLFIPLGYLALSRFHVPMGLLVLYLFYLVRGYATPVLKDYINRITASHIRATVLSVRNFIIRLLFALTGPMLGWVKDVYTLPQALTLAGIIFLIFSLLTAILFISSGKKMEGVRDYTSRTKPS
jgi:MFS family permease